jgi:energy-coupling factor transporter ATP-binding protein EcfA2
LWGWKRDVDADIFLGWVAAAILGGFPAWRSHLYVYGSRGSGKSKLMEVAAGMLGEFGGSVLNDATEAGIRQSRNNQARPILIDEFEPDQSVRNGSKQDGMFALFRRMSGGEGGRVSRGGSDHSAVSFRTLGAAYVTSINHIQLEPQDRSRFVMLDLGQLPITSDPLKMMSRLEVFEKSIRALSIAE